MEKFYTDSFMTEGGNIIGYQTQDRAVNIFKGIHYAAPPVGNLRWKAPQPVNKWNDTKKCVSWEKISLQPKQQAFLAWSEEFIIDDSAGYSEDCLYLNIWSANDEIKNKPVIVYVHGGNFTTGGSSCEIYDGEQLARNGIIFVSVDFRVGTLGLLAHSKLSSENDKKVSGNYQLLDIIAALKWVKNNILDPYTVFANGDIEPAFTVDRTNAFDMNLEEYDIKDANANFFKVKVNLKQFLGSAKHFNTSFMPFFICLLNNSINENFDIGDKAMLVSLPVDLRTVFNTDCAVNFSDAVMLRMTKEEVLFTPEKQCKFIRDMLNEQRKPENYAKSLFNKMQTVKDFEADPRGITYIVTYLGKLDMPGEINEIFDDIYVDAPFGASYFLLSTFKDKMTITSVQHYDDDRLIKYVYNTFKAYDFDVEFMNKGIINQNVLDLTKLKKVG